MQNHELKGHFYEVETPEYMKIIGGEVRIYRGAKRIAFSKNPWTDEHGEVRTGKTVTVNLGLNHGNPDLIRAFETAISILKGEQLNVIEQAEQ